MEVSDVLVKQGLAVAALVTFCGCFNSTSGLRRQPLNASRIFDLEDRTKLTKLQWIRNKMAAHDENLYPSSFSAAIVDNDARAIDTVVMTGWISLDQLPEFSEMARLTAAAQAWVENEIDKECEKTTAAFNLLDRDVRAANKEAGIQIRVTTPAFNIGDKLPDDRKRR